MKKLLLALILITPSPSHADFVEFNQSKYERVYETVQRFEFLSQMCLEQFKEYRQVEYCRLAVPVVHKVKHMVNNDRDVVTLELYDQILTSAEYMKEADRLIQEVQDRTGHRF